jgi:VWFA-related protein
MAARQGIRSVYVSVTEKSGTPVMDLSAADFEVKEDGKAAEVISAQIAKTPIRMAMVVADGGTGGFQQAMAGLLQKLQTAGEFSVISVLDQPERIVDYTTDLEAVVAGIQRMSARSGKPVGGPVMEAIWDTLKTVEQRGKRPVIVVMRMGGSAATSMRADVVRDTIRKTGTRLYVLSPIGSGGAGAVAGGGGAGEMGVARSGYAASESARRGLDLEVVLNDGSKESGGRYEQVSNATLLKAAEQIAAELVAQYQLTYVLAEGAKPSERLEVSLKRPNLRVHAPTRIAN